MSEIGVALVMNSIVIIVVLAIIRFGGVHFRFGAQIGAFAFHRLGIFRKLQGAWFAPIPRTSGITCTLNCQACELAWLGCPIGMIQRYVIDAKIPIYVYGVLVMFGAALGRAICGWICPFGLIQDLLDKVSLHKYTPPQWMRGIKFAFLIGVVLMAMTTGTIFWCRYLCFGALLGVIPYWLTWHTVSAFWLFYHLGVFAAYVAFSYMTHGRAWCRYFCPLGAVLGMLNVFAIVKRRYNTDTCISCGKCKEVCPMDLEPREDDWRSKIDCIKCGRCVKACQPKSLQIATTFTGGFEINKEKAIPKPLMKRKKVGN